MSARARGVVYGVVGHLPAARRTSYEAYVAQGGLRAISESLVAWSKFATVGRDGFRGRFLPDTASDDLTGHLHDAAASISGPETKNKQNRAIANLSAAITILGMDRIPRFFSVAQKRATAPAGLTGNVETAPIQKIQAPALLTPKPPFFLAEPPKGIIPRFMERIPRLSGKEAADNLPGWARGARRMIGETPRDFAKRVMDEKYGPGGWRDTGPKTEFNQIRKFGERAFRDPKEYVPAVADGSPEA